MVGLTLGGQSYLYATSAQDHGLSGWEVSANGSLTEVIQIGQDQSLPVQTMTALVTGSSGGAQFLVAGAAGSSTLTVMQVGEDGTLTVTDHALDTRDTRFANVTELEAVTYEGRLYVLAAGSDHGVSLFTVTAEGRQVHLQSLADSEGVALGGAGNDVAGGGNQNDTMDGGPGDDWFSGGWGDDVVQGNTGNDKLADRAMIALAVA